MDLSTGGDLVARMLVAEGVEVVFGIIDGSYYGLTSALDAHGIKLVSPRHETTAAHMAGAYARTTGRLGVCIASNGPGAANILPGIAVENGEGNQVLVITSWRRSPIVGPDRGGTYQYFDQVGVARPMTKWSGSVSSFERTGEVMRRAFRVSHQGRPGVVHVAIPEDILNGSHTDEVDVRSPERYRRTKPLAPSTGDIDAALELLRGARAPLIQAGSGVVHARAGGLVAELSERLAAPITTSWGGRPAIDARLPAMMPMLPPLIDDVRRGADVVLALGARFGETDWWGKQPYWGDPATQKLIQVDIDEQILGLNKPVDVPVVADVGVFVEALLEALPVHDGQSHLEERAELLAGYTATRDEIRDFLAAVPTPLDAEPMHTANIPLVCRDFFADDAIAVIDGGNTAVWANLYHENRVPGATISTFKFGMLGAGLGQALGAQVAHPDRQVYCILGDGAMGFHPQEIETAVRNSLPVVFLVACDKAWGMVKFGQSMAIDAEQMEQERMLPPERNLNTDFGEIEFDAMARAMGAHGERVSVAAELVPALERCVDSGGPAVIHVDVDPAQHLWAPGLDIFKAMHLEPGE
jgi:acetolactate synthase-1/2/3 large subunit